MRNRAIAGLAAAAAAAGCAATDPTPVSGPAVPVVQSSPAINIPTPDRSWLVATGGTGPADCSTWHAAPFRAIADTEPAARRAYQEWAVIVYTASSPTKPAPADLADRITAYCEDPQVTVVEHDRRQALPLVVVARRVAAS